MDGNRSARTRHIRWPWLLVLAAALFGLGVGVFLVVRGRSLGPETTVTVSTRPTVVIGVPGSPVVAASPVPSVTGASSPTPDYVVQPGDTLRSIAQQVYGDASQWPRIYDANRDIIGSNPDNLTAEMRLRIP